MAKTLKESVADFVRELAVAKKDVPIRTYKAPDGCEFSRESVCAALSKLYTEAEQQQLKEASDAVFARYEIKAYEDVVPLLEVPEELKLKNPEFMPSGFVELYEWAGGSVEYYKRHQRLHERWRDQLRKLHETPTRTNEQGKIELDLRLAMLNDCDLRFVKDHFHGKHLQLVDLRNACLDFIDVHHLHLQGADLSKATCLGGRFVALWAHGAQLCFSNAVGVTASGMYDGCLISGSWVAASFCKGAVEDTKVSSLRCVKFRNADFRLVRFEDHYTPKAPHRFHGSNLYGSDWRAAKFEMCCDFRYATMEADLRDTDLSGCDFRHAICVNKMVVDYLRPLRPKPCKLGAACGSLLATIVKNVFIGEEDDNEDSEDEDHREKDDADDDNAPPEQEDQRCALLTSCYRDASVYIQHSREGAERLLDLVEQGGARVGECALGLAVEVEAKLAKTVRRADKATQTQLKILLQGLKAQAKGLSKENSAEDIRRFDVVRTQLLKLGAADFSRTALVRAEAIFQANATPSALASFLAAQLKRPMGYDVRGFFPMFKAVFTVSPSKMNSDSKEIQRLVKKFEKLDQPVLPMTWTEIADTWTTLYEDYKRMETERGLLILEQIFGNPKILQALSYAKAFHDVANISDPPEELLIMLKAAKVELKRRVDEYQAAADRELVRMEKIQCRQQQFTGGMSILLISIGTSLGNFASQYCYNRAFATNSTDF